MENEEILWKAIDKAEKNGCDMIQFISPGDEFKGAGALIGDEILFNYDDGSAGWKGGFVNVFNIIFSHSFAKAFFPKTDEHGFHKDDAWKYYIQQLALTPDNERIKYLEQFL